MPEERVDDRIVAVRIRDRERGGTRFEPHERGVHTGLRVKRVPRHAFQDLARGPPVDADAQPRVVGRRGLCDHPPRELPLVHQDGEPERLIEQTERQRRRNLVRQVRGHDIEPGPFDSEGVALNHLDLREAVPQERDEPAIGFDSHHVPRPFRQETGEDPQAGTDLQDRVGRANRRVAHVAHRHSGVDEEVLTEAFLRSDPEAV